MSLLEVKDLSTRFNTEDGVVQAVNGVNFTLDRGKVLGIVGESGSGKSATCLSIMGLTSKRISQISGEALFKGKDLLTMSSGDLRQIRGGDIAMIFQDPLTSLNPVLSIGSQLIEAIQLHRKVATSEAWKIARDMLAAVGIPQADQRMKGYPFEFSGGMRQRVMIAMALCNNPDLLIADEPTTALDVTIQAQILNLIRRLRTEYDSAIIIITHDLGVIAEIADEILVMYAGRMVEKGPVDNIFEKPQHPYTWGLMGSLPRLHFGAERLQTIKGSPPSLLRPPEGCAFHPRCPYAEDKCAHTIPPLTQMASESEEHLVACLLSPSFREAESVRLRTSQKIEGIA
jgi:peptide/nickel transport system ATP-binding protein